MNEEYIGEEVWNDLVIGAGATVNWTAATGATGYAVAIYATNRNALTFNAATFITKNNGITISGLKSGQSYAVLVGAVNKGGSSQASVKFTTP